MEKTIMTKKQIIKEAALTAALFALIASAVTLKLALAGAFN
jgi:hypothetical protein